SSYRKRRDRGGDTAGDHTGRGRDEEVLAALAGLAALQMVVQYQEMRRGRRVAVPVDDGQRLRHRGAEELLAVPVEVADELRADLVLHDVVVLLVGERRAALGQEVGLELGPQPGPLF